MLGWMLKRSYGVPEPVADGDTTLADQPDTPAPVFAARAFKSALFGAPSAPANSRHGGAVATASNTCGDVKETPSKPPGILLTPGTGTTRRKRVSFGHDVGAQSGATESGPRAADGAGRNRKRTRLTTAMENASRKSASKQSASKPDSKEATNDSDSEWEEEDDHDAHDVTIDLADPHSESGKYWKKEFHKYRDDAKVEMDKMLKYKRLAKSYAKLKDAEAMELAELLRDEQQKVIAMEKRISESAATIVSQQKTSSSDKAVTETVARLTKETAHMVQYRQRVQQLEDQLDELVRRKEQGVSDGAEQKTSPATNKTIAKLQDEVTDLKAQLKEAKAATGSGQTETARVRELRAQLREAKEESRKKDTDLRKLRRDYEASQQAHESQVNEMRDLLTQSQSRYAELKKEMAVLKSEPASRSTRPRSWHPAPVAAAEDTLDLTGLTQQELPSLESPGKAMTSASSRRQTLREKFRKDADAERQETLTTRPTLEPASHHPQVRRSPRNKTYDAIDTQVDSLAEPRSTRARPGSTAAPDLPGLAEMVSKAGSPRKNKTDEGVDLLKTQFARLGGPDMTGNNSTVLGNTTAKSALPPERRAAALARLERKRVERQKAKTTRPELNKENVRPIGV